MRATKCTSSWLTSEISVDCTYCINPATPNHLSKLFQQEGNIGFNAYLNAVRINQTKRLLAEHTLNLDEIAERVGFKSGDYLGRVFRKSTGYTPGEYRAKYTKNRIEIT